MAKVYAYIDNSNFHIGGQQISAVKKGMATSLDEAMEKRISNHAWMSNYKVLHNILFRGRTGGFAKIWGSPQTLNGFWSRLPSEGFTPYTYERNISYGKERKIDTAIAYQMGKDFSLFTKKDEIILVSGDKDFCPAVQDIADSGFHMTVCCWTHSMSRDLLDICSDFLPLDEFHDTLGYIIPDAHVLFRPEQDNGLEML